MNQLTENKSGKSDVDAKLTQDSLDQFDTADVGRDHDQCDTDHHADHGETVTLEGGVELRRLPKAHELSARTTRGLLLRNEAGDIDHRENEGEKDERQSDQDEQFGDFSRGHDIPLCV